ncbi:MAG: PAS domain-containing sensor histidine kinase [Coriobacteriales bacterium]|nr:PAS domain-containing sensor histidine kinase [Actinomycetes bacterium]
MAPIQDEHHHEGTRGAQVFLTTLFETVAVPVVQYDTDGWIVSCNSLAEPMMAASPDRLERRILTFDGMDVGELVASREAGAEIPAMISTKVRLAEGGTADAAFIVLPIMPTMETQGGTLLLGCDAPAGRSAVEHRHRPLDPSSTEDEALFVEILSALVETLEADAGAVAEVEPDRLSSGRTLAAIQDGEMLSGFEWRLAGTPIVAAAGRRAASFAPDLRRTHPDDLWAQSQGFTAFAGSALHGTSGERVGVLGIYARHELGEPAIVRGIVRLFAARLGPMLQRVRSSRVLQESEQRYAALFEHSHMPMLIIDPISSQVVDANAAACTFYGYPHEDLTAMSILQLDVGAPEDVRDELDRAVDRTRDYFQFKHRVADGSVREVEMYAGPITVQGRDLVYGIVHDVTERRRIEYELQRYKQDLEALLQRRTADLMRSNAELQVATHLTETFYEDMRVELRTPLQTIIGFAETLSVGLAGELTEEQHRQVAMIEDAGRRLLELTDDLVELSRLNTGVERCIPEEFDLCDLVESVAVGGRQAAAERGIALEVKTRVSPIPVYTDRNKVEQVLIQLLSNASKYTIEGSIVLEADIIPNGDAVVRVADTGVGISAEELPHVFEGFRRVAQRRSVAHGGSGLGLAVCHRIAHVIGGRLDAESEPGVGSVFTLSFPAHCPASGPDEAAETSGDTHAV